MGQEASGRVEHPTHGLGIPDTLHDDAFFSLALESLDSDLGPCVVVAEGSWMPGAGWVLLGHIICTFQSWNYNISFPQDTFSLYHWPVKATYIGASFLYCNM